MSNRTSESAEDWAPEPNDATLISTDRDPAGSSEIEADSTGDDATMLREDSPAEGAKTTKHASVEHTLTVDSAAALEDERPFAQIDPKSALRYKIAILFLLGLAAALTFAAAMRFWLPPWAPLAIFLALGVGPVFFWALVGALVFDPTKKSDGLVTAKSPPLSTRMKLALTPVVIGAAAGAVVAALWYLPPVRAAAAHVGTSQRLTATLDSALMDEAPSVRLAACQGLGSLGDDTSVRLMASVNDPDDAVAECALESLAPHMAASSELVTAAYVWRSELVENASISGERACTLSNRLRIGERKGLTQAPMHLMSCALTAESAPARECCAQSFRGMLGASDAEPHMVMQDPSELLRSGFLSTVPALLAATHSRDPEWEQRRIALRLDTPHSRAWAMALGCDAIASGGASVRDDITAAMAEAVSTEACQIGPATETTVRVWGAVCSSIYPPDLINVDGSESDDFCRAIDGALVLDASNMARQLVGEGMRRAREPGRRHAMMKALLDYSGQVAAAAMDGGEVPDNPTEVMFGKRGDQQGTLFGDMMKIMSAGETPSGDGPRPDEMFQQFMMRGFMDMPKDGGKDD